MTILAEIATILGGVAIVIGFAHWLWSKRSNIKKLIPVKGALSQKIELTLDLELNLEMTDMQVHRALQDILYVLRDGKELNITWSIPELNPYKKKLSKLERDKNLDSEGLNRRSNLQQAIKSHEKQLQKARDLFHFQLAFVREAYKSYGPEEWREILCGTLEHSITSGGFTSGTKLELWTIGEKRLITSINISSDEEHQVLASLGLESLQQLQVSGSTAGNLPEKVILRKVIPAIAWTIKHEIANDRINEDNASEYCIHYIWELGLG